MVSLEDFRPEFCSVETRDGIVVVRVLRERLSEEDNIAQWSQELTDLVEQFGARQMVVCLERVVYLSSAAVGKLITLHRRLHRNEGRLVICGLVNAVRDIFLAGRLDSYFTIAPNVDAAVALLKTP